MTLHHCSDSRYAFIDLMVFYLLHFCFHSFRSFYWYVISQIIIISMNHKTFINRLRFFSFGFSHTISKNHWILWVVFIWNFFFLFNYLISKNFRFEFHIFSISHIKFCILFSFVLTFIFQLFWMMKIFINFSLWNIFVT